MVCLLVLVSECCIIFSRLSLVIRFELSRLNCMIVCSIRFEDVIGCVI